MKIFRALILMLAAQWVCSGQAVPKISKDEQQVRAVVKQWADAVAVRDMAALDKLFADDLFITASDGSTRGKKEELEVLKTPANLKTLSVENEDLRVKLYGKSALVTAIVKMRFESGGKETAVAFRYTAVFIKKDGRYQLATLQTTRTVPPPIRSGTNQ